MFIIAALGALPFIQLLEILALPDASFGNSETEKAKRAEVWKQEGSHNILTGRTKYLPRRE